MIDAQPATASLLGVDFAKGLIGWEYKVLFFLNVLCIFLKKYTYMKRNATYPIFAKGIIVAEEMAEAILLAQNDRSAEAARKSQEKDREKAIKNWKLLVRRMLVFKRLGKVFKV